MNIKLIASDLDGTIIGNNNIISQNNLEAINTIHNKNINFAICTGKTYSLTKNICSKCNASYGIFGNGTQIINLKTGEEIYKSLLTKEDILACISIAKKHGLHIHLYTQSEIVSEKLEYMDLRNYKLKQLDPKNSDLSFEIIHDIVEYIKDNEMNVFKLVISSKNNISIIIDELSAISDLTICHIKKYGKYKDKIIDQEYEYIDITPKNIGKNQALEFLSDYLHINKEEVMAIGDNVNDLDMIQNSGVGVAIADSYEGLKNVATYTTTNSVDKGGFAEAVYKFIEI